MCPWTTRELAAPTGNAESGNEPKLENGTELAPNAKDPELTEPPTSLVPQSNLQNDQPPARNGESSNKPKFETGRNNPQWIASYPNRRERLCPKATPQNSGSTEIAKTENLETANQK